MVIVVFVCCHLRRINLWECLLSTHTRSLHVLQVDAQLLWENNAGQWGPGRRKRKGYIDNAIWAVHNGSRAEHCRNLSPTSASSPTDTCGQTVHSRLYYSQYSNHSICNVDMLNHNVSLKREDPHGIRLYVV